MPTASSAIQAKKTRSERLNLRVTREQARLIRLAAKETRASVSNFLIESACLRAEDALASQRQFVYGKKQWEAFMNMLDRPSQEKPRLRKLLTEPSILEKRKFVG
jgi:uncharacterized protein (DUF1778 family)